MLKINNINFKKEMKFNSLMETYQAITEDELNEVIYLPSEGKKEEENEYWLKEMKVTINRLREKNPLNGVKYDLNGISFPNEIVNIYGSVFAIVLYSDENMEDIVYMTRYGLYKDGIKLINTRSTPSVRGKGLALKIYKALKQKLERPIYSDTTHSPFTRNLIWQKLYNESPSSVKAYDTETNQYFEIEMNEMDEMVYWDKKGERKPVYSEKDNGILLVFI